MPGDRTWTRQRPGAGPVAPGLVPHAPNPTAAAADWQRHRPIGATHPACCPPRFAAWRWRRGQTSMGPVQRRGQARPPVSERATAGWAGQRLACAWSGMSGGKGTVAVLLPKRSARVLQRFASPWQHPHHQVTAAPAWCLIPSSLPGWMPRRSACASPRPATSGCSSRSRWSLPPPPTCGLADAG